MNINVSSNGAEYGQALVRFMGAFRKSARETVRMQGRLLGQRMVSFTPPKTASQGKKRVAKDIGKLFFGLQKASASQAKRETVQGQDVVKVFATGGRAFGVLDKNYRPGMSMQEMEQFHQQYRDRRGRVQAGSQFDDKDMGRFTLLGRVAVTMANLRQYIRRKQANVGQARGGWARGVLSLGGRVPAWVSRHVHSGRFEDGSGGVEPFVQWDNQSEWTARNDDDRVIERATQSRTRDIERSIQAALARDGSAAFKVT